jgi:hypothetical protein
MAAIDTATSTGAKPDADVRRRNVPDSGKHQAPAPTVEHDVKKTRSSQVRAFSVSIMSYELC